jgi:hypothetical protein
MYDEFGNYLDVRSRSLNEALRQNLSGGTEEIEENISQDIRCQRLKFYI